MNLNVILQNNFETVRRHVIFHALMLNQIYSLLRCDAFVHNY
jgi:hypothetical protein